jgi:hypothetical protein
MHNFYKFNERVIAEQAYIKELEKLLKDRKTELEAIIDAPELNVFSNMDEAECILQDKFMDRAEEACEGAYNVGKPQYIQEFTVEGDSNRYRFVIDIEYNRHDKTYYYIDGEDYRVETITE